VIDSRYVRFHVSRPQAKLITITRSCPRSGRQLRNERGRQLRRPPSRVKLQAGVVEFFGRQAALVRFMNAVQKMGPPFRPKCQYRDDKYHKDSRNSHLHNAKLRGVFCPSEGAVVSLDAPSAIGIGFCEFGLLNERSSMKSNLFSIAPSIYREYADEYKKLARSTSDELQRALYFKMAIMWEQSAVRFENVGLTPERDQAEGDQEP
jgi:hypothetical protein